MAITYPLSLPTTIGIGEIELRANNVVGVSQSPFTYKQQVVQHQGQRWEASVSIPPVRKDLAEEWIAFLISLKGPVGTFYLGDPNMATPRGTAATAVVTVNTATTAGAETVSLTKGAGSQRNGFFLPGDYIQIGDSSTLVTAGSFTTGKSYRIVSTGNTDFTAIGSSSNSVGTVFTASGAGSGTGTAREVQSLHKVLTAVDMNTSGLGTADIWPHIRHPMAAGTSVTYLSAKGLFRLSSPMTSWSINNASTYGISFDAVEVI